MKIDVFPVCVELSTTDPLSAYASLRSPGSYLLESCEGSEKTARYSFIGFNPALVLSYVGGAADLVVYDQTLSAVDVDLLDSSDAFACARSLMGFFKPLSDERAPFFGGLAGYYAYESAYRLEAEFLNPTDFSDAECELVLAKNNIIFDHVGGKTYLTENVFDNVCDEADARKRLEEIKRQLAGGIGLLQCSAHPCHATPNLTKDAFVKGVMKIKEHICAGDVFQAVLSQRFEVSSGIDPFAAYLRLREVNPSPYMYFFDLAALKIAGASPETLVKVGGSNARINPIAGTCKRGVDAEEDLRLATALLADEKECAEHVMLVDLGRNDLGKVCRFGSVCVDRFMEVERYSHVQHIVSEVEGSLDDGEDSFSALRAVFPAGTVSGAPKTRAMQIIKNLEPESRGPYAGCVGYFSFNGNMDFAITLRTIFFRNSKAYVQAGAGIVADSEPEKEYHETLHKVGVLLDVLGVKL